VSLFTSSFVFHWSTFFPTSPLVATNLPFFDGRVVCYPTDAAVKDYLRWRQVDAHINNLYNTTFWLLVRDYQRSHSDWSEKQARDAAHADMNSTYASSAQKNELLHERFGVNYNDEPEEFRKGSILVWVDSPPAAASTAATAAAPADGGAAAIAAATSSDSATAAADENSQGDSTFSSSSAAAAGAASARPKRSIALIHCDLIHESFYTTHPGIIPYLSATQVHKARTAADKAAKKAAHKAREKEQKLAAGALPSPAPAAGPAVPSGTDAAAAAPLQP
jgi:tRNA(His) guanylyltransferase